MKNVSTNMQEQIANFVKREIINGKYRDGEMLPPAPVLEKKFKVSQGVVREAISVLKAEGFVEMRRGRNGGLFVKDQGSKMLSTRLVTLMIMGDITVENARDIRILLEVDACRAGTAFATPEMLKRLRELADAMMVTNDPESHMRLNTEFHTTISQTSGNRLFGILLVPVLNFLAQSAKLVAGEAVMELHAPQEHYQIVEAIEKGEAELACRYLKEHIMKANERFDGMQKQFLTRAMSDFYLFSDDARP